MTADPAGTVPGAVEVEVEDAAWTAAAPAAAALAREAAEAARGGRAGGIAILLTDDAALGALNARFRGADRATNVLAFPAPSAAPLAGVPGAPFLGDIALAFGVCAREAAEQGKSLADHLRHLSVHGVLHLLGYDHQTKGEAERMEAREREILAGLGVADPYA